MKAQHVVKSRCKAMPLETSTWHPGVGEGFGSAVKKEVDLKDEQQRKIEKERVMKEHPASRASRKPKTAEEYPVLVRKQKVELSTPRLTSRLTPAPAHSHH